MALQVCKSSSMVESGCKVMQQAPGVQEAIREPYMHLQGACAILSEITDCSPVATWKRLTVPGCM